MYGQLFVLFLLSVSLFLLECRFYTRMQVTDFKRCTLFAAESVIAHNYYAGLLGT